MLLVESTPTNACWYEAVKGTILADKLGQFKYWIVGYGLADSEAFKLTIIPLPLDIW